MLTLEQMHSAQQGLDQATVLRSSRSSLHSTCHRSSNMLRKRASEVLWRGRTLAR